MASTLRDELASLKIERKDGFRPARAGIGEAVPRYRRRGLGLRILSWLLWLIPLSVMGAAGVYGYKQYEQIRSKPEVTIASVQKMTPGEAEKLLSASGYLKSRYQAMIGTKIAGRVEKMFVQEGSKVTKDQVLAIIEHHDLKAMLAMREASLARTQAELEEAQAELWEKERDELRVARLHGKKMSTQEDYERAIAGKKKAAARVAALVAGIQAMKANIDEIRATIKYQMHLYAPFDGTVVEKQGEEGEIISPMAMSSSLGRTAVVTVANLQKMEVETDIAEKYLSRIALGQPAEVSVSAIPNKRYRGRLRQVIPMGDRTRGTVKVKVEIVDPDEKLFPELAATVHFLPDKERPSADANRSYLFIPKDALIKEEGLDFVWALGPKSVVSKKRVEIAASNDDLVRVESGLQFDDKVVLKPPKTLRENEVVRIAE